MNKWIVFVNIFRYLILSLSLIGFAFHFAQCALLTEYQHRTNIPGWFSAGHWQYLAWYVTFGLSVLSALAICTHATCCRRSHILRGDKCLGLVNIVPLTATLLANTFIGGQEPWTNGIVEFKVPAKGFITFCNMLNEDTDASYPILFQRCLLLDGTYVMGVMLCISWIILVLCTCFIKVRKASASLTRLPNENVRMSEKNRSKTIETYNHPYTRKHSTSFEESFQYNTQPANGAGAYQKYAVPIAPHMEKVELPASYDNTGEHVLEHQPLTRNHTSAPGGWVEYTTPLAASPYHYQSHGQEENPWYPNIDKNRII